MQEFNNIKKIANIDTKLNFFKRLMAYAATTTTVLSPLIVSVAALTALKSYIPNMDAANALVLFLGITPSLMLTLHSIIMPNKYKKGLLSLANSDYWKNITNLPARKAIQKEEDKIIKHIKNDMTDKEIITLYTSLILNLPEIIKWYQKNLKESTYQHIDFDFSDSWTIFKVETYSPPDFMNKSTENAFKINSIIAALHSKTQSIDKPLLTHLTKEIISNFDINLNLLNKEKLNMQRIEYVLYSGGVKELQSKDYNDIATLMKQGDLSILSLLHDTSLKNTCFVDWVKINHLFHDNYKDLDSNYEQWSHKIKENITRYQNTAVNEDIIKTIEQLKPAQNITTLDKSTINSLLYYNPTVQSQLWQQLKTHCENISVSQSSLSHQDVMLFNEKIAQVIPNIIMSDQYIKNLKNKTNGSIIIEQEISNNLQELIILSKSLIDSVESSVIKTLNVDRKYLKMKH